jgi:O-antigen ligase
VALADSTQVRLNVRRRLPRAIVLAGSVCLIAVFLAYYVGLFSYFRIFYLAALGALAVTLITPFYQQSVSLSVAACLLAITSLFAYFGLTALWSLYPSHTLQMVALESINIAILATTLFWASNASSVDVANLFRWLPRIVLLAYVYMLFRYGMVRGANAVESRAIAAISSGGALTAAVAIPFIMAAAMRYSRIAMIDLLIAVLVLVLSESRTGYLLGVLMLFASVSAYADRSHKRIRRFVLVTAALLVAFGLSLTIPAIREAIGSVLERILLIILIQQNPASAVEEAERLTMYLAGWNAFLEHPVLGIGYQSLAPLTFDRYGNEYSSHNLLLTLVAEAGWPALFLFLVLMAAYFKRLRKLNAVATEPDRDVIAALRMSMVGLLIGSMFHQLIPFHFFHVLLGATFGLQVRSIDTRLSSAGT